MGNTMKLLFQSDIFSENNEKEIAKKHFELQELSVEDVVFLDRLDREKLSNHPLLFRGSLLLAQRLKREFPFADATRFYPAFRKELVNDNFHFLDAHGISQGYPRPHGYSPEPSDLYDNNHGWPKFIRPTKGTKAFSGNVYTKEKFNEELEFLKQNKNFDETTLCVCAPPVKIYREWRCVFVNKTYVSGAQYMVEGEKETDCHTKTPKEVEIFAKKIAKSPFFDNIFEFTIDIGLIKSKMGGELRLIEVNSFECADFYENDLEKIYHSWVNAS